MDIKIIQNENGSQVLIDGKDISKNCTEVKYILGNINLAEVTLKLLPNRFTVTNED